MIPPSIPEIPPGHLVVTHAQAVVLDVTNTPASWAYRARVRAILADYRIWGRDRRGPDWRHAAEWARTVRAEHPEAKVVEVRLIDGDQQWDCTIGGFLDWLTRGGLA